VCGNGIFVGYCESLIAAEDYPQFYCRFVDDSLAYFPDRNSAEVFQRKLDGLHPALRFTCEHESNERISFLDVLVERQSGEFVTSIFRKPTFTGMCLQYDAYCPMKYKIGLVRCLVNRAHRICSPSKLSSELEFLKQMFEMNGYPEHVINRFVTTKLPTPSNESTDVNLVFLRLPFTGCYSDNIERRVRSAVNDAFRNVRLITVYNTPRALTMKKDILPTTYISHTTYSFECRGCASRYVGRTILHLSARVRQHVPLHLLPDEARSTRPKRGRPRTRPQRKPPDDQPQSRDKDAEASFPEAQTQLPLRRSQRLADSHPTEVSQHTEQTEPSEVKREYSSAIATHLAENHDCRSVYSDESFVPLSRGRSHLHLDVLESVYIKVQRPVLCRQKNYIAPLHLYSSSLTT